MYTEDGQPYFSTFMKDANSAHTYLDESEMVEYTNDASKPRRVANHLYADGPMKVSQEPCEGIIDLNWFINATIEDDKMKSLLQ